MSSVTIKNLMDNVSYFEHNHISYAKDATQFFGKITYFVVALKLKLMLNFV